MNELELRIRDLEEQLLVALRKASELERKLVALERELRRKKREADG